MKDFTGPKISSIRPRELVWSMFFWVYTVWLNIGTLAQLALYNSTFGVAFMNEPSSGVSTGLKPIWEIIFSLV